MADLVREFFKRDLQEREWDELTRLLQSSGKEADRFALEAGLAYSALGLAKPRWSTRASALKRYRTGAWILASAALVALGLKLFAPRPQGAAAPAVIPQAAAPAQPITPAAQPKPKAKPAAEKPKPAAAPDAALPDLDEAEHEALSVEVALERAELVSVKVLDSKGNLVRGLFAGMLEPGTWTFEWDGIMENGERPSEGSYEIEVRTSGQTRRKPLVIRPE